MKIEEEDSLMKNIKSKMCKILVRKGTERKRYFKNPSSPTKKVNKSIESININFLIEIFVFLVLFYFIL